MPGCKSDALSVQKNAISAPKPSDGTGIGLYMQWK